MAHRYLAFDKNGQYINTIETAHLTNNNFQTLISTRRSVGGAIKTVNLAQVIGSTGTTSTTVTGSPLDVQNDTYAFIARSATMDITQTPTTNQYVGYEIRDKNNARCAYIGATNKTDGAKTLDVQLHNVKTLNITGMTNLVINGKNVPYVTEHVISGTSWYELWSDGWIRQGGRFYSSSNVVQTITLLKNFSNTNYVAISTPSFNEDTYISNVLCIRGRTTSSFKIISSSNVSKTYFDWYACGK